MNLLRAGAKAANRRHHEGKDGATGFRLLNRANVAAPPSQNPTTNWIYRSTHRRAERGEGAQIIAGSALETSSERRPASDRRPLHDDEAGSLQMLDQALGDDRRPETAARTPARRRRLWLSQDIACWDRRTSRNDGAEARTKKEQSLHAGIAQTAGVDVKLVIQIRREPSAPRAGCAKSRRLRRARQ